MPPSLNGKLNGSVGVYDVSGAGRAHEGWEGVQHLLLVSIFSLYDVALFGCVRSNV